MSIKHILEFDELYFYDTLLSGVTFPALLRTHDTETEVEVKLDTGASHSFVSRIHGENLGIDIESGEPLTVGTIGNTFQCFGHDLTIQFQGIEVFSKVYFFEDAAINKSVLGRQGWLDRVKLGLIDYEGKLLLSSY